MSLTTTPAAAGIHPLCHSISSGGRRRGGNLETKMVTGNSIRFARSSGPAAPCRFRVFCSGRGEADGGSSSSSGAGGSPTSGFSNGDLGFLLKLGGASLAGAAAIKYGSIVFPEMTRPNLTQALLMISLPVALSILLLSIYQSPPRDVDDAI